MPENARGRCKVRSAAGRFAICLVQCDGFWSEPGFWFLEQLAFGPEGLLHRPEGYELMVLALKNLSAEGCERTGLESLWPGLEVYF